MTKISPLPKFIVDRMYYRVARVLRMLGYDTIIDPDFVDVNYILKGKKEGRILVTRDEDLKRRAEKVGIKVVNIDAPTLEERLVILSKKTDIKIDIQENVLARCTLCNSEIDVVPKEEIINQLKNGTKEKYDEFWKCKNTECNQIYWQGSHWEKLLETIAKTNELLKK
ncbi:MAG: hypothetical protein FK733_07680 [Asgard group archaeon]|nr:hypothetical protein [Asgard group archaeon]